MPTKIQKKKEINKYENSQMLIQNLKKNENEHKNKFPHTNLKSTHAYRKRYSP